MKAIVYDRYGSPAVLQLREIDRPVPKDDQVLVRVNASSVNPIDWHRLRGQPYFMRGSEGLRRPKNDGLGADLAGRVEAVGRDVTLLQPGDEVFGMSIRTLAEYAAVPEKGVVQKPANLTFEQAAAVPLAALTALQGLRDKGGIEAGQNVLVNGAAGGVGTFAVQLAKAFGAEVTGVCSTRNAELVRSIGADHVVDYTREDFTRSGQRYDLILDAVANRSLSSLRRATKPDGVLALAGGAKGRTGGKPILFLLGAVLMRRFVSQTVAPYLTTRKRDDLLLLKELIETGQVTPVIDRSYSLSEAPEAIRYLEQGHARGKVVITV
ncbi:MAG TPA: NAD(P)-dependent alcohol dehydrogenase [Solirubrobacterales bacterium]|nr:NAD(P)-dependent alcohol dehydrogenase [Solirubrobacterales bacterium]